jgi:hypothetical protein
VTRDEISGGREPRRWLGPVIAVTTVVAVLALLLDRAVDGRETSSLRRCVAAAEADLNDIAFRTAGVEQYVGSRVNSPDVPLTVRSSLTGIVEETVLRGLPALRRDRAGCADGPGWHPAARAARRDYLGYLDLRLGQLALAAQDIDALHTRRPDVQLARERARLSLARLGVRIRP